MRRESIGGDRRDGRRADAPGAPPTMDLDGARSAVEQASMGLAHPSHLAASEATLLEFRRSPHALPACRHILQTSPVMEACFQAAATLRDAALRDWSALPPEERAGLRQFCLGVVLGQNAETRAPQTGGAAGGCPASAMPVVVKQLVSVLAVMIKRAWLDVDETKLDTGATQADYANAAAAARAHRQQMLAEAERAVSQASTNGARVIGLNLFAAVITEFAPSTASPMQLPWDFHERCRVSLQNDFLLSFFEHAVSVARAAAAGGALAGSDEGVCVAALRLMNGALAWDFQFAGHGADGGGFGFGATSRGESPGRGDGLSADAVKITPGRTWRDALLAPGSTDWVFELHHVASRSDGTRHASSVARAARATVSSLCALAGDVFPSKREDPAETLRLAHFARCAVSLSRALRPARPLIASAARAGGDSEEALHDGARGVAALAAIHAPGDFYHPPVTEEARGGGAGEEASSVALAATLGELTVGLLEAGALRSENDGAPVDETLRMCVEAWGALAERSLAGTQRDDAVPRETEYAYAAHAAGPNGARPARSPEPAFPGQAETSSACASVFEAYLRAGLEAAAAGAHEDDDGHEEEGKAGAAALDERMSSVARVARAAPDVTLPLLRAAMERLKNELGARLAASANGNAPGHADPSEILERLWWLARLVPHVLCDAFEGEFPLPPDAVAECARRAAIKNPGGACPVTETGSAFLRLVAVCLDETAVRAGAVSPRLVEQLVWGAARWTDTYLMPEDVGGSAHAALFGGAKPSLAAVGRAGDGEGRVRGGAALASAPPPSPFSEAGGGVGVVDALLRVALVALTAFPGEESAQRVAAKMLLPALTRRRALCRACVSSQSWAAVADASRAALESFGNVCSPNAPPASFPPEIHRFVAEALCRAADGVADERARDEYVARALAAANNALTLCAQNPTDMKHPAGEARAVATLEALRGAARASAARSQRAVFAFFQRNFEALLAVQRLGTESAQVTKASLRLCEAFVEAQACFLPPADAAALCGHCARVVETYKASGRGALPPAAAGSAHSLRAERAREAYKEVKALLRVLTHVSSVDADAEDGDAAGKEEAAERGGSQRGGSARGGGAFAGVFGPGGAGAFAFVNAAGVHKSESGLTTHDARDSRGGTRVDVPSVVLAGLHATIPLLTEELLRFPKLCRQYFALLAHMLEAYPAKVAALDAATFATLMRTLEFGLTHADVDIGRESFAALSGLAAFHHRETKGSRGGNPAGGLAAHNAANEDGKKDGILARFLKLSLNRLLFEDASAALAEPAADALLPLMLCEREAFAAVAHELVSSLAGDARAQGKVGEALRDLTASGGLTDRVDRANKRRFRRNVSAFVLETRAFVRRN